MIRHRVFLRLCRTDHDLITSLMMNQFVEAPNYPGSVKIHLSLISFSLLPISETIIISHEF